MAYTDKQIELLFTSIIDRIENGEALRVILRDKGMPSSQTFYIWLDTDEKKSKRYVHACEQRADIIFDEILEIADNTIEGKVIETDDNGRTKEKIGDMLGHRRLQIDSRKWVASKMNPKKYGDASKVTVEGGENPLKISPQIIITLEGKNLDLS